MVATRRPLSAIRHWLGVLSLGVLFAVSGCATAPTRADLDERMRDARCVHACLGEYSSKEGRERCLKECRQEEWNSLRRENDVKFGRRFRFGFVTFMLGLGVLLGLAL